MTMTVNGADATFKYGENILSALETKFGEGEWYAVVDGDADGNPRRRHLRPAKAKLRLRVLYRGHYALHHRARPSVTEEMLAGVSTRRS